jgi:hypothetical protein
MPEDFVTGALGCGFMSIDDLHARFKPRFASCDMITMPLVAFVE